MYIEISILTVLLSFLLQCLYDQAINNCYRLVHCGNVLEETNFANDEYNRNNTKTNQNYIKKWLVIWILTTKTFKPPTTTNKSIHTVTIFTMVVMSKNNRNSKLINTLNTEAMLDHASTAKINTHNISASTTVNSQINYVVITHNHQIKVVKIRPFTSETLTLKMFLLLLTIIAILLYCNQGASFSSDLFDPKHKYGASFSRIRIESRLRHDPKHYYGASTPWVSNDLKHIYLKIIIYFYIIYSYNAYSSAYSWLIQNNLTLLKSVIIYSNSTTELEIVMDVLFIFGFILFIMLKRSICCKQGNINCRWHDYRRTSDSVLVYIVYSKTNALMLTTKYNDHLFNTNQNEIMQNSSINPVTKAIANGQLYYDYTNNIEMTVGHFKPSLLSTCSAVIKLECVSVDTNFFDLFECVCIINLKSYFVIKYVCVINLTLHFGLNNDFNDCNNADNTLLSRAFFFDRITTVPNDYRTLSATKIYSNSYPDKLFWEQHIDTINKQILHKSTLHKNQKTYGIGNFFNHFQHTLAQQNNDKLNTGYMISTVNSHQSHLLFDFIHKNQHDIKNFYKSVEITMDKALRWITLRMPEHRYHPIKTFIKNNFNKSVKIRYAKIPNNEAHEKNITQRLQIFSRDSNVITKAYEFIEKYDYYINSPILKQSINKNKYHLKCDVPNDKNIEDIRKHFNSCFYQHNLETQN